MSEVRQSIAKKAVGFSQGTKSDGRVVIKNINVPGRTSRVDGEKYEAMRSALLRVLPKKAPGLTQGEMFKAILSYLPDDLFPGGAKANWWAKTVQLDLEARRLVTRENTKPLRWHRS